MKEHNNRKKANKFAEYITGSELRRYTSVAIHNCTTADTCLKIAYDEIKDRKGKMIDGVFVKEADL